MDLINQDFCFLGKNSKIIGDLNFTGPTHISGEIEGNIQINENVKLIITPNAIITGSVKGGNIEVYGKIQGDIYASEILILFSTSKVKGKIITKNLKILAGAQLNITGHAEENE